jgi:hypothetical protein
VEISGPMPSPANTAILKSIVFFIFLGILLFSFPQRGSSF